MTPEGWPSELGSRFTPHALLGRGQFGSVFEVIDQTRNARVALKVLNAEQPRALHAFKREFRALADLAHHHLVSLYELGRQGDRWFLSMELVEGRELLPALAAEPARLRSVFAQIALGLEFLHGSGRLHRDLKPANVRVTPTGRAVLLDFGLAIAGRADADEGLVGSAAYLSPEQAAGADASVASDLYALGVMLHEALTGRRPFEGGGLEVLAAKRSHEAVVTGVPAELHELISALLARDPARRPSASRVVSELEPSLIPLLDLRPDVPLLGREEALRDLSQAFTESGHVAVWISAAPGVGKTALLRHFVASQPADSVIFSSRCFEHESTPFRAIDGWVDDLTKWLTRHGELDASLQQHAANLARSFPAMKHVAKVATSSAPVEAHLHESAIALRELIAFVASKQRLVLVIDDLHWVDADSIPFLRELLDGLTPPSLLFVGALREEGHRGLEPFRRSARAFGSPVSRRELALLPLGEASSAQLARVLLRDAGDAGPLLAAARGNPLLLQTLAGQQGGLRDAVGARIAELPDHARALLECVCLFNAPLPCDSWPHAKNDTPAVTALRVHRLVRERPDGALEPYHDTLRRTVVERLSEDTRAVRHGELAAALGASVEGERLTLHLAGAGRLAEAAEQAVRGAHRAVDSLAFNHAATLLQQALTWAPEHPRARARRIALGEALANAGRGEEAANAFLAAAALPVEDTSALPADELERRAAAQLLRTGHIDRGLELTRKVLGGRGLSLAQTPRGAIASMAWTRLKLALRGWTSKPRARVADDELARIDVLTSTSIGLAAVDSLRAADLMGQALHRALVSGDSRRLAICLGFETAFTGNAGAAGEKRMRTVAAHAARLVEQQPNDDYVRACVEGGFGIAHFHLGELQRAIELLHGASACFVRCPGAVKELFTLQLFSLAALAQRGELEKLGRRLGDELRLAIERGDRYAESNLRSGLPNLAWLGADDEARARTELELARPGLETSGYSVQHFFVFLGRFQLELYAGKGDAVVRVFEEGMKPLERALLSRTEWIAIAMSWMRGRVALASGAARTSPSVRNTVIAAAETLEKRRRPWGNALAASLRAGERHAANDATGALAELVRAERLARDAELLLHAECARLIHAKWTSNPSVEALARDAAKALGARNPERMCRVYLPGLDT